MKINSQQAKNIVKSLNDLIYDDIYVYDNKGKLLATNRTKADEQVLEFGKVVAKEQSILVKDVYDLSMKAIFFPVHIGANLVAIVGLVGDYTIISQYSALVVKIVEILLSESIYYQRKIKNAENNRLFVHELIFGHNNIESLTLIGNMIGEKVDEFNYMALIDITDKTKTNITIDLIVGSIEKKLSKQHLVSELEGKIIIIFTLYDLEQVKQELTIISNHLEEKYKKNISIGISDKIKIYTDCQNAYYQAKKTLIFGKEKYNKGIFSFNEYSLELLFLDVNEELADSFVAEVFKNITEDKIRGIEELLRVYIDNNASLNATSKELFIHKNTLQYRLNKVQELTGYNPRNTLHLYKLFTAINLFDKNRNS